ncbi:MAG: type II toxin-antitoxin system RelE/ParE family toxin [Bacteroidales bacterium]|nr:type II toxin-antitoxin system RelE/ParE family toxin [Bacteroidales bacterium]
MFKRKLIWSSRAKIELLEILDFYKKRNGNANYSRKLYTRIEELLELCKAHSFIGKRTDFENVRVLIVDDYLIFYEVSNTEITVLTIWSSRRNSEALQIRR